MSKKLFLGAAAQIFKNAKALRNNMTLAETILWGNIKGNQLGTKFRRQHPLGIYIADFYSHQCKLIIELDGGIHYLPDVAANDLIRQAHLEADGYKILRFTNQEVFNQLEKKYCQPLNKTLAPPLGGRGASLNE
ncbi:endonuclease domain-containing protein [Inquilinus sp. KBS0705]|nr:endonuclease domain-containing protein [Inquilinus sp. KBS0705]